MSLDKIFSDFMRASCIFKNRDVLSISFTPDTIPHREKQINELARIVAPALLGSKPSNVFIYGRCGTGKTLVSLYVTRELVKRSNGNVKTVYINCKLKGSDTKYRLFATITKELGKEVPFTGLPTDMVYNLFIETIEGEGKVIILILDEIDVLTDKTDGDILYTLTRVNQELKNSKLSIIGITNKLGFIESLDPRVRSSLSEEELIFPPYNALQLKDILIQRARLAFSEGVLEEGVIEKCAALAAQEHGDARRALDLLRVAGEIAERSGSPKVKIEHVDMAEEKIDTDKFLEIIKTQPKQSQLVLYTILRLLENRKEVQTGDVFNEYSKLCREYGMKILTQRRVSDLIAELDLFDIISTKIISLGRYGRTRIITLNLADSTLEKIKNYLSEVFT
ncbi:MAG: ORC1-type DNA replication protein [Candidatus Micrarchaeota archaeon]|nr:ORC1-type DNA replication protein [Candidatus Micrarchaeota archaeon]